MSESLEQRVAQLEKMLLVANEEIQRLKDRREDLDMVTEKAQQLEKTVYIEMDKHRILANKVQTIDEEHARMFLMSERIAHQAEIYSLQYSTVEESMGHVLKSMRRHDDNIRTVNDNATNLRISLVKRIDDHIYETKKNVTALEKQMEGKDELNKQLCFKIRTLEQECKSLEQQLVERQTRETDKLNTHICWRIKTLEQECKATENEMVEKINKLVANMEKPSKPSKQSQRTWKQSEASKIIKFHDEFPSL